MSARPGIIIASTLALALALGANLARAEPLPGAFDHAQDVVAARLASTEATVAAGRYPYYTMGSSWYTVPNTNWGASFLPGSMWLEYQRTRDVRWRQAALVRQASIASLQTWRGSHDLGFLMLNTFRHGYRLTGSTAQRDTALKGAETLSTRFDPVIGMLRSRSYPARFTVIVDTMMNIELLFWAADNGGSTRLRNIAVRHALRTAHDFMRADGSSFHYVTYSPSGAVTGKGQSQGASPNSTWARGQAWLIYGMTVAYRETGDERFLDAARRAAAYWVSRVPADMVPYWDFDAPHIPDEPRDSSAAAIVASALTELGRIDPDVDKRALYTDVGRRTLESLSGRSYLSEDPAAPAALLHGTYFYAQGQYDQGTSWGDYYFAEALGRLRTRVQRVAGPDRYAVAVRASQLGFDRADTVVIAGGASFADALAADGLAGACGAPVLLTRADGLPDTVKREVARLGASRVYIVGGARSVSRDVESALSALAGVTSVERIGGSDRYEVAAQVANKSISLIRSSWNGHVILARGDVFADALAASPVSYSSGMPILLTRPASLPASTARFFASSTASAVVICGGVQSVSDGVERSVADTYGLESTRIAGPDRYSTAAAFASWATSAGLASTSTVTISAGTDWPSAVAGGSLAGSRHGVSLLTARQVLSGPPLGLLRTLDRAAGVQLLGGEASLTPFVEDQIRTALPEQ